MGELSIRLFCIQKSPMEITKDLTEDEQSITVNGVTGDDTSRVESSIRSFQSVFVIVVVITACLTTSVCITMTVVLQGQVRELREEVQNIAMRCMSDPQLERLDIMPSVDAQDYHLRTRRSPPVNSNQCNCTQAPTRPCRCRKRKKKQGKSSNGKNGKRNRRPRRKREHGRSPSHGLSREKQLVAGHYVSGDVLFPVNDPNRGTVVDCKQKWDGTVCRNSSFIVPGRVQLKFFTSLKGMNSNVTSPFEVTDGDFRVTKTGLYMIYLQVLFDDRAPEKSVGLLHKSSSDSPKTVFKCTESDDTVQDGPFAFLERRRKNCNFLGVKYLHENETLLLKTYGYYEMGINLSHEFTYFGAVQIAPV